NRNFGEFIAYPNIGSRRATGYRTKVPSRQSRSANVYEVGTASTQCLSGLLLLGLVAKERSVTETSSGMAEEIVWRGTSSLWRNTDTLELYRVKDIETRQPFLSRLVGVENVQLNTSDTSSPFVFIEAVPSSVGL